MSVLPQSVYRRSREPRELPTDLRLRALEWALYFAVSGKHTAAELGKTLRTDVAESMTRLLNLGLVAEQELDASEYVNALAASGDREEKTLREFLLGVSGTPAVPTPTPALPPAPFIPPITRPIAKPQLVRPTFGFKPLPSPEAETKENRDMSGSRRMSLRALMNVIENHASSREAGQLDVYRVFVRVDTLLLKRNGIETLRFTEDRLVADPELEQALVKSMKKTLGLECPESVWVA
ncbi:MAG: hypothetical protein JOZ54_03135 [Acidobacteria bacterium]|nr:hypothetical protein [Acidobacteriota bacterium]